MITAWLALRLSFSSSSIAAFSRISVCFWLAMTFAACSLRRRCCSWASVIACSSWTLGSAFSLNDAGDLGAHVLPPLLDRLPHGPEASPAAVTIGFGALGEACPRCSRSRGGGGRRWPGRTRQDGHRQRDEDLQQGPLRRCWPAPSRPWRRWPPAPGRRPASPGGAVVRPRRVSRRPHVAVEHDHGDHRGHHSRPWSRPSTGPSGPNAAMNGTTSTTLRLFSNRLSQNGVRVLRRAWKARTQ